MTFAKKSLGQNFLNDPQVVEEILAAADLKPTDTVLEIGPGKGALTTGLLKQAGKVIAVELDADLIPFLKIDFGKNPKFEIVHADALKFTPPAGPYKIVANIPYYITSPLLNHYLHDQFASGNPPERIVFMVQKEVAEKIMAEDGNQSVLSLQVQLFGDVSWVCTVPRTAFRPMPKVDSAVIAIDVHKQPKIASDLKKLFWLFHMSFAQKRKKLSNNLANALRKTPEQIREMLRELGIDENVRAEALTMEEWGKLTSKLATEQQEPSRE